MDAIGKVYTFLLLPKTKRRRSRFYRFVELFIDCAKVTESRLTR